MKCKRCGAEMPDAKRTCSECGAFLEGYTLNNVTGEYGYRGADGNFYKSEEDYHTKSSADAQPAIAQAAKAPKYKKGAHVWAKRPKELAGRTGYVRAVDTYRMVYEVTFGTERWELLEDDLELVDPATEEARQTVVLPTDMPKRMDYERWKHQMLGYPRQPMDEQLTAIIIKGKVHRLTEISKNKPCLCKECSLQELCDRLDERILCDFIGDYGGHHIFRCDDKED